MDFNISRDDVKNFIKSQNPPKIKAQTAINKQITINNAIATRNSQAPQGTPVGPISDGFGRTV